MQFVFHLFFASLNVMLVFSSGIILYTGLYNSPETQYLLTLPVRAERIVLYKFQEAVFLQQLGILPAGQPDHDRLRDRGRSAVVLLRVAAAADRFVRLHSVRRGGDLLLARSFTSCRSCGRLS